MVSNTNTVRLRTLEVPANGSWSNDSSGWSLLWVSHGRATFQQNSHFSSVATGHVVVMPQGVQIAFKVDASGALVGHSLFFNPDHLPCIIPLGTRLLLQRVSGDHDGVTLLPEGNSLAPLLRSLAEQSAPQPPSLNGTAVRGSSHHSCPCPFVMGVTPIMEELKHIVGHARGTAGEAGRRVISILGKLKDGELQELTLNDLARRCGCSRRHLARLVREQCGSSLAGLVVRARLERAADLLHDPERKIVDVAMDCGFNHMGSFSARFRERFGMTPAVWRKNELRPRPHQVDPVVKREPVAERIKAQLKPTKTSGQTRSPQRARR